MTYELLICFFIGFIVGALSNRNKDDKEQKMLYDRQNKAQEEAIQYYKRLCKTLADENAEFRRKL